MAAAREFLGQHAAAGMVCIVAAPSMPARGVSAACALYNRRMQARRSRPHAVGNNSAAPLGGLAVGAFLRRHWHKRALLVRAAIPGFDGSLDLAALQRLAMRDDV